MLIPLVLKPQYLLLFLLLSCHCRIAEELQQDGYVCMYVCSDDDDSIWYSSSLLLLVHGSFIAVMVVLKHCNRIRRFQLATSRLGSWVQAWSLCAGSTQRRWCRGQSMFGEEACSIWATGAHVWLCTRPSICISTACSCCATQKWQASCFGCEQQFVVTVSTTFTISGVQEMGQLFSAR